MSGAEVLLEENMSTDGNRNEDKDEKGPEDVGPHDDHDDASTGAESKPESQLVQGFPTHEQTYSDGRVVPIYTASAVTYMKHGPYNVYVVNGYAVSGKLAYAHAAKAKKLKAKKDT